MKRWFIPLAFVAIVAGWTYGLTQSTDPVAVEWVTPTNGSTVSGTINLTVNAQSSAAPIVYVDFYRDGVFFKRVYNEGYLPGPTNLAVNR